MLKNLIVTLTFLSLLLHLGHSNPIIDSLLVQLDTCSTDRQKVHVLNDLAWEYAYLSPIDGMAYAKEAKNLSEKIKDDYGLATAFGNLGVLNDITGQYDNALIYYKEAAKLYEKTDHKLSLAGILNNIGVIYGNLKKPETAFEYYKRALSIELIIGDEQSISDSYINLGVASKNLKNYDVALDYLDRALAIKESIKDTSGIMVVISNISVFYLDQMKLDSAQKYLDIDLDFAQRANDTRSLANVYMNLCLLEQKKGNYTKSIEYGEKAKEISRSIYNVTFMRNALDFLAEAYLGKQDFRSASDVQKEIIALNDTIFTQEKKELISNLESKYQSELREGEVLNLRIQNTIKEAAISQERKEKEALMIFIGFSIIILLILLLVYFNNRKKNKQLKAQNDIIQEAYKDIEELIKESHHRIKNNLQVVSSMLKLQARSVDSQAAKDALADAQKRMKAISIIHQKLYQEDSFKTVNIKNFLVQLLEDLERGMVSSKRDIRIESEVDELEMRIDAAIPLGLVVNELITNSLKYAFNTSSSGIIWVSLKRTGEQLVLKVEDNGVGFEDGFILEEKANFGYRVLKSLLRKYKGEIFTSSENGAKVHIILNKY